MEKALGYEVGTGSGRRLTLPYLKMSGAPFTIDELLEVVVSKPKGLGSQALGSEFPLQLLYEEIIVSVSNGTIQQLGPKEFRFVPEHPINREFTWFDYEDQRPT
jgi:hypothetical protein